MQNQKVHKENFNYLFKDRGGAFEGNNPETLYFLNTFKTYIENIVSYVRKHYPALPEVYVDFVNNLTLNAGAVYYKGGYYIGLYLGAKIIIGELFNAELSLGFISFELLSIISFACCSASSFCSLTLRSICFFFSNSSVKVF